MPSGQTLSEERIREIFLQFAADKNNVLSRKELKNAFKYLGAMFPTFRALLGIYRADANGNRKIDSDELDDLVKYANSLGYTVKG
ncbi:hypothetical protein JCGZ_04279 [Jatropha curcas]|uniref:EF-hand domain-containing protein n=1 Tax=Jatropha curcas TaxID=180498 RepID=A0A067L2M6_JATCU|nr:hypothetical protein JCGZ_04279 [Jatropha curcas]